MNIRCNNSLVSLIKDKREPSKKDAGEVVLTVGSTSSTTYVSHHLTADDDVNQPVFQDSREYLGNASTSRTGHYRQPYLFDSFKKCPSAVRSIFSCIIAIALPILGTRRSKGHQSTGTINPLRAMVLVWGETPIFPFFTGS